MPPTLLLTRGGFSLIGSSLRIRIDFLEEKKNSLRTIQREEAQRELCSTLNNSERIIGLVQIKLKTLRKVFAVEEYRKTAYVVGKSKSRNAVLSGMRFWKLLLYFFFLSKMERVTTVSLFSYAQSNWFRSTGHGKVWQSLASKSILTKDWSWEQLVNKEQFTKGQEDRQIILTR